MLIYQAGMARYLARADKPGRDNWPRYEASYHARFGGKGEISRQYQPDK